MATTIQKKTRFTRFAHIDAMRAFAVTLVVVSHAELGQIVPGGAGVTIFFAISGFIITYILLRERDKTGKFNVGSFYAKRAMKLIPSMLVAVVIPTIIYSFFSKISWDAFAAQIFFVYNWVRIGSNPTVLPGSGVIWSLAIEEQFYIVFALIWLFASRHRFYIQIVGTLATIACFYSVIQRIVIVNQGELFQDRIYFGTDTRLDSIAVGIIFAIVARRALNSEPKSILRRIASSERLLLTGLLLFAVATAIPGEEYRYTLRFTLQSVATAIVILVGVMEPEGKLFGLFLRVCQIPIIQVLGLASYSIYLTHYPVFYLLDGFMPNMIFAVEVAVKFVVGTSIGILLWRVVEVPVERFKGRVYSAR